MRSCATSYASPCYFEMDHQCREISALVPSIWNPSFTDSRSEPLPQFDVVAIRIAAFPSHLPRYREPDAGGDGLALRSPGQTLEKRTAPSRARRNADAHGETRHPSRQADGFGDPPLTTAITETIIHCANYIRHGWC